MSEMYNFGISQDDALSENAALRIDSKDHLLCVASAGEVPLNILAMNNVKIDAVDISQNQINLCKLKLAAIQTLEPREAASFLGFLDSTSEKRSQYYEKVSRQLDNKEKDFWENNFFAIEKGPIRVGRFEKYIRVFSKIGILIIGRKRLLDLFEIDSIEDQRIYFDENIANRKLKLLFRIAFNPKIYKKRGMDESGLQHSGNRDIAQYFFEKFRSFCTGTLARKNYYLQLTFFGKVLFEEAFPEYLQEKGVLNIRRNSEELLFLHKSFYQILSESHEGKYNKFALSNIGDWMTEKEFQDLLILISHKAKDRSLILTRYIHLNHPIPKEINSSFEKNITLANTLSNTDRYPFYSFVPIDLRKSGARKAGAL